MLPLVYADRTGAVADNIESRTAHIEETVYAVDDSDVYRIDSDRLENHCQHYHKQHLLQYK